ncbi:MAG: hypothetical protein HYY40_10865 [Bacteroidetes bacterium]|nr:hypothetical protein [Bacteroidota bacterium]
MKTLSFTTAILLAGAGIMAISVLTGCKKKGCTDPNALNYNPDATKDDGSCQYLTTIHDTITVQVHDTLRGKAISGNCTYPDFSGVQTIAAGAVISLYLGTSVSGNPVATAIADINGNYLLPYLLPNNYFIYAIYNTENQNVKAAIEGINFETNPGYAVVMASADLTQNLNLATVAATGSLRISIIAADTGSGGPSNPRYAPIESHSKTTFEVMHLDNNSSPYLTVVGGFNVFKVTEFYFDEATPANTRFRGYVLLSTVNTNEPGRDKIGQCASKALQVDTFKVVSATDSIKVLPQSDTAFYYATAGQVEKYGKGYLSHGTLETGFKHQGGEIVPPRVTPLPADTALGYTGPWGVRTANSVDMYFEYQGKKKVWNSTGTTFNWYFEFEGEFTFNRKDFYIKHGLGDEVKNFTHLQLKGLNNVEY